jgi:hypothetical protein
MCLASHDPKEFGRFHSVARSGQESIAQGLPWAIAPARICPEGATRYGENPLQTFELALTGRNVYMGLPRVNPGLSSLAPTGRTRRAV